MSEAQEAEETQESQKKKGQIDIQENLLKDKKRTMVYLKSQVKDLDRNLANNFANGNFTLAAHDARRMAALLDVLGDIDLTQ